MEGIEHRTVEVNGIKMHIAEKGQGPVVLFLHGFPELWYSWRHQILAISSLGYHAVAPDLRGFGDTDRPESISSYSVFHIAGDIIALIDFLGADQVHLVGHDWGTIIGWYICLFRPERIRSYVCLSIPSRNFFGKQPQVKPLDVFRAMFGDDYYICRFQEPGKIEAQIAEVGIPYMLKNIFTTRQTGPPIFPKGEYGTGFNPNTPEDFPSWFTEEDLAYYVSKFDKTGLTGGLNYYRCMDLNWELSAPWTGVGTPNVPVKFITGEVDIVYTTPGVKDYIHGAEFKKDVPNLVEVVVQKGVAHFNNQEAAEDVSNHIYDFINKF